MDKSKQKTLLSGVKPTGKAHIGNYFGAMRQFVDLQEKYQSFIFIADYHALISIHNKDEMKQNMLDVALDYLAIGIDPEKTTLFKQSDVSAHTELAWIFNCIETMPHLMRAHAFKDAEAKDKEISVGVFDYPILMAADILLYDPDIVPVGQDQKQHVEIARDMARKFNATFGETFKEPKEYMMDDVKVVPGIDGRKMSKSYNNTIPLFADESEVKKAVMGIPTDSKGIDEPKDVENDHVFSLHKLFASGNELTELEARYKKGGIGYKESKELLIKNILVFTDPLRKKRAELAKNPDMVLKILHEGGKKAKKIADKKMDEVREKIGVKLY